MRLSWNEVRARAAAFAAAWAGEVYEKGDTQSFYNDFFEIFGVRRRSVARFERHVQKLDNSAGYIDLFWPGVLLVEQKSGGRDLIKAYNQAGEYFDALKEVERPRYILVSDFITFTLYDLDDEESTSFYLEELPKHVEKFSFILGVQKRSFKDQDPVNIKAAELVGKLHDSLEDSGYTGHDLERFLVRLVFCLFSDDTGVFEPRGIFQELVETRTGEDGSDLGVWLAKLFEVLDTPEDRRGKNLDEDLARFPYINGDLFKGHTRIPDFNSAMRGSLLAASRFDWSPISPAIFGSLFQSVKNREERRREGAHYTTEKNILKVVHPLFLDDLRSELNVLRLLRTGRVARLTEFQEKLSSLSFLDPACGCGNFLVIAYREVRLLELEVLQLLFEGSDQLVLDVSVLSKVDVDQFAGIEIDEFASRIAQTAMWMMDHIMNARLSLAFGKNYARLPLKKSPVIVHGDALATNWASILSPDRCSYILGNPPFVGHAWRTNEQQAGMHACWGVKGQVNRLDYVTCWFRKAVEYAKSQEQIRIGFVATNSISQGEQASILWSWLYSKNIHLHFAHRTFEWTSESRGRAAVHCIILGLARTIPKSCTIFDYPDIKGEPVTISAKQINAYLVDGPHVLVPARTKAPQGFPPLFQGSKPADGARLRGPNGKFLTTSNLILDENERVETLRRAPELQQWLKPYVGGDELISGEWRWCLWLKNAKAEEMNLSKELAERLERVRKGRLQSPTESVREFAKLPWLFTQDRQPDTQYLAIPEVSSESREYIPICLLSAEVIASNKLLLLPRAETWLFAVITSTMHMAWMRTVSGRLKSDYSYAPTVYNSFPWPDLTPARKKKLAEAGQKILDARASEPSLSLGELYHPKRMPTKLRIAHQHNDRVVDRLYLRAGFTADRERVAHLLTLFQERNSPIESALENSSSKKKRKSSTK